METQLPALGIDTKKEAKIRAKILSILSRKVRGVPIELRQGEFHKMVGCSIKAVDFKAILAAMKEEKLIMQHHRQHIQTLPGGQCWALWDHPGNIRQREWSAQCKREFEEYRIAWENSPAGKAEKARKEAELVRQAQERFNAKLRTFLMDNEEDLFELIRRLFVTYMPEKTWKES
jgi:hypothetical protein